MLGIDRRSGGGRKASTKSPIVKRFVVISRHQTDISVEEAFWTGMKDISSMHGMTLSALASEIDGQRMRGGNLSSAVRLFVLNHYHSMISPLRNGAHH